MVATFFAAQCSPHWKVIENDSPHRVVVVFGDSLALGVGASTPDNGFMQVLFRQVRQHDPSAEFDDYAVAGATANDVLSDQVPRAESVQPTDVWICVGANDATHGTPAEQYAKAQRSVLQALRTHAPGAHIVVFGVPDVSRSPLLPGIVKIKLHNDAAMENDAARDAARDTEAEFVDLFSFSDRNLDLSQDFSPDGFHPNDHGYAAVAEYATRASVP